jgi:hypothetical protein
MPNLYFDLPEDLQFNIIKMNKPPYLAELKYKIYDSWFSKVVQNYRNPHYIFTNEEHEDYYNFAYCLG